MAVMLLLSTTSWTVGKHYCMGLLVDISLFAQAENCGMEMSLESFIPSAQGIEKELQEMNAVLECTDRRFLTDHWREVLSKPNGRSEVQRKVALHEQLLGK